MTRSFLFGPLLGLAGGLVWTVLLIMMGRALFADGWQGWVEQLGASAIVGGVAAMASAHLTAKSKGVRGSAMAGIGGVIVSLVVVFLLRHDADGWLGLMALDAGAGAIGRLALTTIPLGSAAGGWMGVCATRDGR